MYEDEHPVTKSIPQQKSQLPQSSPFVHTLLSEIQNQCFNDSQPSQDILITNWTNSFIPKFDDAPHIMDSLHTKVITQTPIKPTFT